MKRKGTTVFLLVILAAAIGYMLAARMGEAVGVIDPSTSSVNDYAGFNRWDVGNKVRMCLPNVNVMGTSAVLTAGFYEVTVDSGAGGWCQTGASGLSVTEATGNRIDNPDRALVKIPVQTAPLKMACIATSGTPCFSFFQVKP